MVGKIVGVCAAAGLLALSGCRERSNERIVPEQSVPNRQLPPAGGGAGDAGTGGSGGEGTGSRWNPTQGGMGDGGTGSRWETPQGGAGDAGTGTQSETPQGGSGDAGSSPQGRRMHSPRREVVPVRQVQPGDKREEHRVRGKVRYVGPATVRIEDDAQRWYDLQLTPQTEVTLDGRGVSVLKFSDGTFVDAEFRLDNGNKIATKVRVLSTP